MFRVFSSVSFFLRLTRSKQWDKAKKDGLLAVGVGFVNALFAHAFE